MSTTDTTVTTSRPAADEPVASPCVKLCRIACLPVGDAAEVCEGCLRTLEEISAWSRADDAWRRTVWERIARRREILGQR